MKEKRSSGELVRRYLFLLAGLAIMALGVAFSVKASLGTSPISSTPYVVSLFTTITVGQATIVMSIILILLQILILRRRYQLIQLIQLPISLFFSYMIDFFVWVLQSIVPNAYWQQWILCVIGIILVAVGVSFEVISETVTMAGEGLVLALCQVLPIKFGTMKVIVDVCLVSCAVIISFIFLHRLVGVREGTVAAALLVGTIARRVNRVLQPIGQRLFTPASAAGKGT